MKKPLKSSDRDAYLKKLISQVQDEKIRDYIQERIMEQMRWYSAKSADFKKRYHRLTMISVMLSASIPIITIFADGSLATKAIVAALGSAVTAISAYLSLKKYADLWRIYRNTRESLLRTLHAYFYDAGIFASVDIQSKKDVLFVEACEETLSNESNQWLSTWR